MSDFRNVTNVEDKMIAKSRTLVGKHRPCERLGNVYINVEFRPGREGVEVSFTSDVISSNGKWIGGGQHNGDDLLNSLEVFEMPKSQLTTLLGIWDYWHLNGMRAGCEHQRKYKEVMTQLNIVEQEFFYASNYEEVVKLSAFGKCPECGYTYGHAWKHERLPIWIANIIFDLFDMPVLDRDHVEKALMAKLAEAIKSDPMDVDEKELLTRKTEPRVECGCCGAYHRESYVGDCRNDAERFDSYYEEEEN